MWTRGDLTDAFHNAGLGTGDLVLVHSSLRKLGPVDGGAETVIDALLEVVGDTGTVAVPTHTYEVVNPKQPVFHQTLTPSNVGTLTNVFLRRPHALRSLHPTHSVAAIGPLAERFVEGHERSRTPCSATTPYGRLRDWGGKVLIIGETLNRCTLFHGCEEWAGLSTAFSRDGWQLRSIRADGTIVPVTVHPFTINTWDQYPRLEPMLVDAGCLKVTWIGACSLRLLDARPACDRVVARLRQDPGIILPDPTP